MRYIKTLHLKNFQSYKNQTIHFNEGLNLILGSSDSGKSALMRAISFVLYNYPRNNTLIHHGEDQTEVTVTFSDGLSVTRIKGRRNAYIAKKPDGKIIELDKVDKSVPEEIKTLLNNPPEDDFNGLISYADQFSKMFLVDLSPTDLPRSLSNLTGVEILEQCAKSLMQSYKSIEKQLKNDEKELDKISNEFHAFDELMEVERLCTQTQLKIDKQNSLFMQIEELLQFSFDINYDKYLHNLGLINDCSEIVDLCLSKISIIENKINELNSLNLFNLMNEYDYTFDDVKQIDKLVSQIKKQHSLLENFSNMLDNYNELNKIDIDYQNIKNEGIETSKHYQQAQSKLKDIINEYNNFIEELKSKNIICDKCGSMIK